MDRINGADTVDIGGGKRGFQDEDLLGPVTGTEVTAEWLNEIQEELCAVIEAAGIDLDPNDWGQLLRAIQKRSLHSREIFTASGTFTVPAGVHRIRIKLWGAGGGGGGSTTSATGSAGGGGGYSEKVYDVTPGDAFAVIIGAGGSAGASGGGAGGQGGVTAAKDQSITGGGGGLGASVSSLSRYPGVGGVATGGDINLTGGAGSRWGVPEATDGIGSTGGHAAGGGGLGGGNTVSVTYAASTPGGGGKGAGFTSSTAYAGGAGAPGMCIVEW